LTPKQFEVSLPTLQLQFNTIVTRSHSQTVRKIPRQEIDGNYHTYASALFKDADEVRDEELYNQALYAHLFPMVDDLANAIAKQEVIEWCDIETVRGVERRGIMQKCLKTAPNIRFTCHYAHEWNGYRYTLDAFIKEQTIFTRSIRDFYRLPA